jgi:hypothetical protein
MMETIEQVQQALSEHRYVTDRSLATVIFLALKLSKPLFLEGEAGVGKTEVGKVLASMLDTRLIRLQCMRWTHNAVYEWAGTSNPICAFEEVLNGRRWRSLQPRLPAGASSIAGAAGRQSTLASTVD